MRGRLTGSLIAAVFGLVYVLVNTGQLPAPVAWGLRACGVAALVLVLVRIGRTAAGPRGDGPGPERGFGRSYWLVVAVEAAVLVLGARLLAGPLGMPQAGVAWVSLVVGLHFFALARVFGERFFDRLGAALTACGVLGLTLAGVGADAAAVDLVAGVVPGGLLLASAWWGARRPAPVGGPVEAATAPREGGSGLA